MAHINAAQLITNATNVANLADRAYQVKQDPAVQKACVEAREDSAEALKSIANAVREIGHAWSRLGPERNAPISAFA